MKLGIKELGLLAVAGAAFLVVLAVALFLFWKFASRVGPAVEASRRVEETPAAAAPSALALAPLPPGATTFEIEFRYDPSGFPLGLSSGQADRVALSADRPAEVATIPEDGGELQYGTLRVAGLPYLFALGAAGVYLDANQNGDLTDDPGPFANEGSGGYAATIEIPALPYRAWFFLSNMGGATYYASCHRASTWPNRATAMVLFDATPNGRYDDEALAIDWNANGRAEPDEIVRVGGEFEFEGVPHRLVSIDPSGARAVLAAY